MFSTLEMIIHGAIQILLGIYLLLWCLLICFENTIRIFSKYTYQLILYFALNIPSGEISLHEELKCDNKNRLFINFIIVINETVVPCH